MAAYPQQYAPSLAVTAAVIPNRGNRRMVDLAHLDGPVPDLLENTAEWVRRNTRNSVVFGGDGHGDDVPEISLVAVREFVANALVHRDLSPLTRSKRVEVRLFPDRLVITNPGGLWGVSTDRLGELGGKSAVNEFLYDICHFVRTPAGHRVIEGEGGGIREAKEALREAGLPDPVFVDTGVSFTVIVSRDGGRWSDQSEAGVSGELSPFSKNQLTVMRLLSAGPRSVTELMAVSGLTRRQVRCALDRLVGAGRVRVSGGGQGVAKTTYRLVEA